MIRSAETFLLLSFVLEENAREREKRERESPLFLVLFHFSTDYTHIYLEFYSGFIYINIVSYRQKIERERDRKIK